MINVMSPTRFWISPKTPMQKRHSAPGASDPQTSHARPRVGIRRALERIFHRGGVHRRERWRPGCAPEAVNEAKRSQAGYECRFAGRSQIVPSEQGAVRNAGKTETRKWLHHRWPLRMKWIGEAKPNFQPFEKAEPTGRLEFINENGGCTRRSPTERDQRKSTQVNGGACGAAPLVEPIRQKRSPNFDPNSNRCSAARRLQPHLFVQMANHRSDEIRIIISPDPVVRTGLDDGPVIRLCKTS